MEKTIEIPEGYEARIEGNKVILERKESEDERIRSLLVWQVHRNIEDETNDLAKSIYDGIKGHDPDLEESIEDWKKCLAYLEKQKEQKPAEQPSIPSNIDEVAEEYAYNNWEDNDYHTGASKGLPFDAIGHTEKCFKAGAEWMAGQFQKIEGELVDWYSSPEGKDYCCGVKTIDSFEVPEGFYIRKK